MSENNDADKRPRIYVRSSTSDQNVEVTVKGAEGETSDDIEEKAKEMFRMAKQEDEEEEVSRTYE